MKALYFNQHGGVDNLQFGELPDPERMPGEVLVRVEAAALNRLDLFVLAGWKGLELEMPHVGGADMAGVVLEADQGSGLEAGDRVVAMPGFASEDDSFTQSGDDSLSDSYQILGENRAGVFSEQVSLPEKILFKIPDDRPASEACSQLLTGLTCWRMLKRQAPVKKGDVVLVVGTGGGVNSFAIQFAKSLGATIVALASTSEKEEKALALGASLAINYHARPDWHKNVLRATDGEGVDIVVDNVGAATFSKSIKSLKKGGSLVTVGNSSGPELKIDNRFIFSKQIKIIGSTMGGREDFEQLLESLWSNNFEAVIDSVFPMAEGQKAYQRLLEGGHLGKIILSNESS